MRDADFSGSRMERADFSGANLSGANLEDAIIRRAIFKGANLEDTSGLDKERLARACGDEET